MFGVDAAMAIRRARAEAGLSLRDLARRAGTSHATLIAYEQGRIEPSVATWSRILRAAGFEPEVELARRAAFDDGPAREAEVLQALRLASVFPARHHPKLLFPKFGVS
ncbi:MAG TPA: helix-turn-helix transcriptional regulator [Acidimicrobiales bacterium]|nr:helix-turn-helix transcriptional regulator [Acidimicrobiales bacterium]